VLSLSDALSSLPRPAPSLSRGTSWQDRRRALMDGSDVIDTLTRRVSELRRRLAQVTSQSKPYLGPIYALY